jgi:pimeloyl-ACP methyl ester carboxylesterase
VAIAQDVSKETSSIAVPTLVIGGELDQVDTPEILEKEVISIIPNARLEIVKGSGHLLPLEAAREVSTLTIRSSENFERLGLAARHRSRRDRKIHRLPEFQL